MTAPETPAAPTEIFRVVATETRGLTTTLAEAVEVVAANLAQYTALQPLRDHAKTLREVMTYAAEGYETIAQGLDAIADTLDAAHTSALATVQALHAAGDISDKAAAALNQILAGE